MHKNYFFKKQYCSTDLSKISLKFTDKVPFFADLSVSKTHFTDKPAFSNDLSVNFWQLWWGFTDTSRFLEHLSVKPCPKRLNFYGQSAGFDHFVRNRHFLIVPFTDRRPIFIDVSVNAEKLWKNKLCPPVWWIMGKVLKTHTIFQFCAIVNLSIT